MAKLVFDIETSALPLETFDEAQQEYLFREAEKIKDEDARQAKRLELQRLFSLWPLTARVVCIAMLNAETSRGQVLFTAEDYEDEGSEAGPVEFVPCMDEVQILTAFWDVARHYEGVITCNGRGFDVPFIYLRSALLNVPISRKDWLGYRFQSEAHCDLADQFTFYGGSREGAARVSPTHGNFIVNEGGASADEIRRLIERCREQVRAQFGVELRDEIVYLGFGL